MLVARPTPARAWRSARLGLAVEQATIESEEPLRADGLTAAFRQALTAAGLAMADIGYRIGTMSGEQYWFKEVDLATSRLLRGRHEFMDSGIRPTASARRAPLRCRCCSASRPMAARKGYARGRPGAGPRPSNDDGRRAALVLARTVRLMANDVFANGREIACKAGDGQVDLRLPRRLHDAAREPGDAARRAGPYPNTGMASDTTDGSTTVKISGKEVMLKNKSYFKKSMGDEAGCAAKKGVVTSVNRGKVYFIAWSMDVKFEGENVVRHLDMTTHNHASPVPNTPPQIFAARMALMNNSTHCRTEKIAINRHCGKKGEKMKCPSSRASRMQRPSATGPRRGAQHARRPRWTSSKPMPTTPLPCRRIRASGRCGVR